MPPSFNPCSSASTSTIKAPPPAAVVSIFVSSSMDSCRFMGRLSILRPCDRKIPAARKYDGRSIKTTSPGVVCVVQSISRPWLTPCVRNISRSQDAIGDFVVVVVVVAEEWCGTSSSRVCRRKNSEISFRSEGSPRSEPRY